MSFDVLILNILLILSKKSLVKLWEKISFEPDFAFYLKPQAKIIMVESCRSINLENNTILTILPHAFA